MPRPLRISSLQTCSSTRCAAASARGRESASTCSTCPRRSGQLRKRSIPTISQTTGRDSTKRSGSAENLLELERRRDLELFVGAVGRRLVWTPSFKDGGVAEPRALHVVVLHLAHALDAQRLPR